MLIIDKIRGVISADQDDYFEPEIVLYYANKALQQVVSYLVTREKEGAVLAGEQARQTQLFTVNRSLRALDTLRDSSTVSTTYVTKDNYKLGTLTKPSSLQFSYLNTKGIVLREIELPSLSLLDRGIIGPTEEEGFFYVLGPDIKVIISTDSEENDVDVFFIKEPTAITNESETVVSLPDRLENAIIYGAAVLMVTQENIRNEQTSIQTLQNKYQEELRANIF